MCGSLTPTKSGGSTGGRQVHTCAPVLASTLVSVVKLDRAITPPPSTIGGPTSPAPTVVSHSSRRPRTVAVVSRSSNGLAAVRSGFCPTAGQHPANASAMTTATPADLTPMRVNAQLPPDGPVWRTLPFA